MTPNAQTKKNALVMNDAISDDVDPDIRRFVDIINGGYNSYPDFQLLPLVERRTAAEAIRAPWNEGGPVMARTENVTVEGVAIRIHIPHGDTPCPALIYIHGGGWTMFSINSHDRLMREYAARAGIIVIGVDYSLSPEAKFPRALDEILATVKWTREKGADFGIDINKIAIGGDSAGGNMAVATCLRLKEQKLPQLQAMVLNYGAFDPAPKPSYDRYDGPQYTLTPPEMDIFWDNYARNSDDMKNPLLAPAYADTSGLPPAFFAIAQCDILADCNHALAEKMEQSGGSVVAKIYEGATHSFLEAMSIAPLAARALDDQAHWLKQLFGTGEPAIENKS